MKRIFDFCSFSYWLVLLGSAVAVIHSVAAYFAATSERLGIITLAEPLIDNGIFALALSVAIGLIANLAVGEDKTV